MTSPAPSIWRSIVRDRTCARPGCGKRLGLEIDHRQVDYRADGPTELDNLVRSCPDCHALKTFGGWRLEGKPGRWKWLAPAHPKSAQYITRARKLAAAKANAQRTAARGSPATETGPSSVAGRAGNASAKPRREVMPPLPNVLRAAPAGRVGAGQVRNKGDRDHSGIGDLCPRSRSPTPHIHAPVVHYFLAVRDMKELVIRHGGIDVGRDDGNPIAHPNSVSG